MNPDLLARAVALARQTGHVLLATVSADGIPHLAAAGPIALDAAGRVLALNRQALAALTCAKQLVVIPGATHLFEEPGTLDQATRAARDWFLRHQ